jgi:hypothetical protein
MTPPSGMIALHVSGVHPHLSGASQTQLAPAPQKSAGTHPLSGAVHGITQKKVFNVGSASLFSMFEQIGAVPGQSVLSVQYLPTPMAFPLSPGFPQAEKGSPASLGGFPESVWVLVSLPPASVAGADELPHAVQKTTEIPPRSNDTPAR